MTNEAEEHLISRCQRGESAAWDELFNRHYSATQKFVLQLGFAFTREDVEEICQEVFLKAIRKLDSFRGHCRFQTWLFRIAINKAKDHQERQCAAKRGGGHQTFSLHRKDPQTGLELDVASDTPGPDSCLLDAEKFFLVGQALDQLGSPCRELIEMRYFAGLSFEDISKIVNLNTKTVGSRLNAGLSKLKRTLEGLDCESVKASYLGTIVSGHPSLPYAAPPFAERRSSNPG